MTAMTKRVISGPIYLILPKFPVTTLRKDCLKSNFKDGSHLVLCVVVHLCPILRDPMNYSTPSFPVHQLPPRICSNSRPLSRRCHPTISSSVIPFSSHFQSFPASGSFPMSQLFTSDGQSIGASASASVLPMNIQG